MAKLPILLATFLAILFFVDASIYRTTVIIDEENTADIADIENRQGPECREQVQMQQNLRQCQEYIMREIRGRSRHAAANDNEYSYQRPDPYRGCCRQLQRMYAQCRCEGLRMAIRQQQTKGQLASQEMMEALRVAEDLPARCGVSPRQCRFSSRWMD